MRSDARRNQERLEAAAIEVFREQGLGAPLEAIARRAGVSVGTLYNRFGSREALIDAVIPSLAQARLGAALEHARAGEDAWARLDRFVRGLTELQIADPALSDAIASAYPGPSPELAVVCNEALDEGARLIEAAQRDGTARADFGRDDLFALLIANAAVISATGPDAARRLVALALAGAAASA